MHVTISVSRNTLNLISLVDVSVELFRKDRNLTLENSDTKRPIEYPTWGLIVVQYTLWALFFYAIPALPWWIVCPIGALLIAWYGNLQHEILHGHPTDSRAFNSIFAWAPLTLWMPYHIYNSSHLAHHQVEILANPDVDPESYYYTPQDWQNLNLLFRSLMIFNNTITGRIIVGPAIVLVRFFYAELLMIFKGDFKHLLGWAFHAILSIGMLYAIEQYLGMDWWYYAIGIAYPGLSISLIRSFSEHRPSLIANERTVVVEANLFWSLLFLNNNLHVVHHSHPTTPWYQLPQIYDENREAILLENGGFLYKGYGEVFSRFWAKPKDIPVYPI